MSIFGFGKKSKDETGQPKLVEKAAKKDHLIRAASSGFPESCLANFRSQYPKSTRILIGSEEISLQISVPLSPSLGWHNLLVKERGANGTKIQKHSKGSEVFAAVPTEAEVKAGEDLKEKATSYITSRVEQFGRQWQEQIIDYFKHTQFSVKGGELHYQVSIKRGMKILAMEMPRGLVDVILGKPGDTKQSVSKNKTKVTAFYGAEKGARGGVSYQVEVKFENDVVVGWKEK